MPRFEASRVARAGLCIALVLAVVPPTLAAVDMFLEIEGVDGESRDSGHRDEIDILTFGWEMGRGVDMATGRNSGGVEAQDLSITKYVDKSSPALLAACASGKHIPAARLTVRKAGARPIEYLVIELRDVVVSSISTGTEGAEDRPTENVTLNFGEMRMTYTPQRADGSPDAPAVFEWSFRENRGGEPPGRATIRRLPR